MRQISRVLPPPKKIRIANDGSYDRPSESSNEHADIVVEILNRGFSGIATVVRTQTYHTHIIII